MFTIDSSDISFFTSILVPVLVLGFLISAACAILGAIGNRRMRGLLRSVGLARFSENARLGHEFFERYMPDEREQGFPLWLSCDWVQTCCLRAIRCHRFDEARRIFRMFPLFTKEIREEFEDVPKACAELANRGLFALAADVGFRFYGSLDGGTTWVKNMHRQAVAAGAGSEVERLLEKYRYLILQAA